MADSDSDDKNSADSSASVVVPVRNKIVVTQGEKHQYQLYNHFFTNDKKNSSRQTHSRRVYHYDVPDDILDENKQPPRDSGDYLAALGDKDSSQYLDVEIIDSFTTHEKASRDSHGNIKPSAWQGKIWLLDSNNDELLHDRDGDTSNDRTINNPADGIVDPPWRLDPLQNIVNVNFVGLEHFLVFFGQAVAGENTFETTATYERQERLGVIVEFYDGNSLDNYHLDHPGSTGGGRIVITGQVITGDGTTISDGFAFFLHTIPWPVDERSFTLASTDGIHWIQRAGPALPPPAMLPTNADPFVAKQLDRIALGAPATVAYGKRVWIAVSSSAIASGELSKPTIQIYTSFDFAQTWIRNTFDDISGNPGAAGIGGRGNPKLAVAGTRVSEFGGPNSVPYTTNIDITVKGGQFLSWFPSTTIPQARQGAATLQFFSYISETGTFFMAYAEEAILYSSKNGTDWGSSMPFTEGTVLGVAYDAQRKRYVCIGVHHSPTNFRPRDQFLSATSDDGLSWNEQNLGEGTAGAGLVPGTKIAFGNGIFVAAVSRPLKPTVWVSRDGVSWIDAILPEIDPGDDPITDIDGNVLGPSKNFAVTHLGFGSNKGLFAVLACQGFPSTCQSFFVFTSADGFTPFETAVKKTSEGVEQYALGGLGVGRIK